MKLNSQRSVIFMAEGASLPLYPAGFIETSTPPLLNTERNPIETKRSVGDLGATEMCSDANYVKATATLPQNLLTSNKAGDALDTLPSFDLLAKGSGMEVAVDTTIPGQETWTYKNSQTPSTMSLVHFVDGFKRTMTDSAVGNLVFTLTAGEFATAEFSMQGFVDNAGVSEAEANPVVVLPNEDCIMVSKTSIATAGGTVIPFDVCTIDLGMQIEEYYTTGQDSALKQFDINDYIPKITLSYYEDSSTFIAAQQALADESEVALVIKIGTNPVDGTMVNGKSIEFTAPVAKYEALTDSEDKQSVKRELVFNCQSDDTKTNIQIKGGFFA